MADLHLAVELRRTEDGFDTLALDGKSRKSRASILEQLPGARNIILVAAVGDSGRLSGQLSHASRYTCYPACGCHSANGSDRSQHFRSDVDALLLHPRGTEFL